MAKCASWREAIEVALNAAGGPLHYTDIWAAIKDGDLFETKGATPENTIKGTSKIRC